MSKYKFLFFTFFLIAAIGMGIFFLKTPTKKQQTKPVKFGYLPISGSLALFVAQDKGYFDKNGVKVELIKFESSNPLAESLVSGAIDAEIGTSTFVMATLTSKTPNKIKAIQMNLYDGKKYSTTSLIVKSDSEIKKVADLKGKKIACFPGATNKTLIRVYLQKNNAYDENTEIIEMAAGLQLQALENGSVDAVSIYEPYGTIGELSGKTKFLVKAPIEKEVLNPWLAGTSSLSRAFIKNRPDEAAAVEKAMNEAAEFMRNNPQEAKLSLLKYSPITDKKVLEKLPLPNTLKASEINSTDFQKMIDLFYNEKLLEKKVKLEDLIK